MVRLRVEGALGWVRGRRSRAAARRAWV